MTDHILCRRRFAVPAGVEVISIPIWNSFAFQSVVQEIQCPALPAPTVARFSLQGGRLATPTAYLLPIWNFCPFQFGTGLFVSFRHLWIHRDGAKHSRRTKCDRSLPPVDTVWEIRYDIAHDAVQSLSLRFARSDVSRRCRYSCGSEVHVKEFDAVGAVLRPFVSYYACGRGRIHRISFSVVSGIPVSRRPSVELEVAHCAEFLLRRGRSEPESAQLRRVGSRNWTISPSKRVVHIAALQHVFSMLAVPSSRE